MLLIVFTNCRKNLEYPDIDRHSKIPNDIIKRTPETDSFPPILNSNEYEPPVPLGAGVNTAGAEDSPFILPDGKTLYFVFVSDVRLPVEQQLLDSVSGVWVSYKVGDEWTDAERVWLQDPGKLSLDGAVCIQNNEMWFASAREGYTGVNMFTAEWIDGKWKNWKYVGDRLMKEIQIGEVHIFGNDLYFHSSRSGGHGGLDIWKTTRSGNNWSDPVNINEVNYELDDILPFISVSGNELWFTRFYNGTPAVYRSKKIGNIWSTPELIVSQFAGEPTLDAEGNLYFVHHFYENGQMIEADIYFAKKR
ncbi:MAG: hypothetical protein ABIL20_05520 [candidate division WOR-3 bacterium]